MKSIYFILFFALFNLGLMAQVNGFNRKIKLITNKTQISMLNGNPISFYLNHPCIDKISKKFYKGALAFRRDSIPNNIMDSLLTRNSETRPFYFFLFNQFVVQVSGKMTDRYAFICTEFVENYPCEFFNSFNQPYIDINVVKWTTFIGMTLKYRARYADFKGKIDLQLRDKCFDIQDLAKSFFNEVRMCLP